MNILALFSGPYAMLARLAVVGIILLSAFATGWIKGNQHGTQKLTDYQAKQIIESSKVIVKQGAVTEKEVVKYVKVKGDTEVITNTIEKEVLHYVESTPLSMACSLDNRWIRLHDSAALGALPPTRQADDASAGKVTTLDALPTVTKNYDAANRNAARLEFCQNWVRGQFKATNGKDLGY